jgi:hypothetical protein
MPSRATAVTVPPSVVIVTLGGERSGHDAADPRCAATAASRIAGSDDFGVPSA